MASTNFARLARVRESAIGVAPISPVMESCFIRSDSIKLSPNFVRSETITGNRAIKEHIKVGEAVEGSGEFEWEKKNH